MAEYIYHNNAVLPKENRFRTLNYLANSLAVLEKKKGENTQQTNRE